MRTVDVLKKVLAGKRMSEASRDNYEGVFRSLGKMYDEFPSEHVEINEWLVSLGGYADTTVRLWFVLLRVACRYMEDNFDLPNPCKGLQTPRVRKKRRRYFRPVEIARILRACRGDYEFALVASLIDSTCRIGELAGLRVRDVGDGWLDVKGKTGEKRYRLDGRLCELLKRLGNSDTGTIFGLSSNCLSTKVIRICRRAGLTGGKLGPHTLRHSSASLVASETKNVMAVKALLQHDDISTSMLYIHDVDDELQKGISPLKLFAERFGGSGGMGEVEQLALTDGRPGAGCTALVPVQGEVVEDDSVVDEMALEMFPDVGQGVEIRPLLKSEDLELIRKGFLALAGGGEYNGDVSKARVLLKRMLRKVRTA